VRSRNPRNCRPVSIRKRIDPPCPSFPVQTTKGIRVRTSHITTALLASIALAGCQVSTTTSNSTATTTGTPPSIAQADLQAAASDADGKAFYAANNWQAAWTDGSAKALVDAIDHRAAHGLDQWQVPLPAKDASPAAREAGLTRAALLYAGALAHGVTDPTQLYKIYTLPRPTTDVRAGLLGALKAGKLADWLGSLAPQSDTYKQLSKAYLGYRKDAGTGTPGAIPPVEKPIEIGDSNPRVPIIAARLVDNEYLPAEAAPRANGSTSPSPVYTPAIAAGVKRLQADYGIEPDGKIGADTLELLNQSPADLARATAVALERQRWLDRAPPATRIDVNLATARLNYWRDGKVVDSRKVVVGDPETPTPQLGSPIFRLVANPTWTIPRSIQEKDLKGKSAAYLHQHNMAWKDGWIVQQPGPQNSLGLVKFDMQNDHAIYLHDTPAKTLFDKNQRQLSHGCIRVFDALGFAGIVAAAEGVTDEWNKARATGKETFVKLPQQIPVRLLYDTVVPDGQGGVAVRTDPYGWNDAVSQKIGFGVAPGKHFHAETGDVGP
jgi:murein L,D-transpeptidase YcbB/YkuD